MKQWFNEGVRARGEAVGCISYWGALCAYNLKKVVARTTRVAAVARGQEKELEEKDEKIAAQKRTIAARGIRIVQCHAKNKEQKEEIEDLEDQIDGLKAEIDRLKGN